MMRKGGSLLGQARSPNQDQDQGMRGKIRAEEEARGQGHIGGMPEVMVEGLVGQLLVLVLRMEVMGQMNELPGWG